MNPIPSVEKDRLFKEAISESDSFLKSKDFDQAFKSLDKASLLINNSSVLSAGGYERGIYLGNLITIKDRQAGICIKEKNPKYDYYLIYSLESFALDLARNLVGFPHISGFYYRKKIQYSPYYDDGCDSLEICPDTDGDLFISLKHLKIFPQREEMYKEYLDFVYNQLPVIYGISPKYNEESIKRIFDAKLLNSEEWNELIFRFPDELLKKSIAHIPYEINKFVTKLLKKYFDMGNP